MGTTMGMGIGTNTDTPDEGRIRGAQVPVACGVWFTSTGRTIPKLIKYENEDGSLTTLSQFNILYQEEKHFCGIPTMEYHCEVILNNQCYPFLLLHYIEAKEWKLWWKCLP
ncbi:MAG: hypothetical protein R3Y58_00490 [Eubacteriales bacterium]